MSERFGVDVPPIAAETKTERAAERPTSGDFWVTFVRRVLAGKGFDPDHNTEDALREQRMLEAMKADEPTLLSAVPERTCNLACTHCLYPTREKSTKVIAEMNKLGDVIVNIARQLPQNESAPSRFLHSGKILQEWHLPAMKQLREVREDIQIGLIDNGTYLKHVDSGAFGEFRLDWIDISVDGLEEAHNAQREPDHKLVFGREPTAFKEAVEGLTRAREIVKHPDQGGWVASLMTVSSLNYRDIEGVAELLFAENPQHPGLPMADRMNITFVTPLREANAGVEISKDWQNGNLDELKVAWAQIKKVAGRYNTEDNQRIFPTIYRHEDIEKIALAIGPEKFFDALKDVTVAGAGEMHLTLDGVPLVYSPLSLWPREEFIIDADASQRTAYFGQYSLNELSSGRATKGESTAPYTVDLLTPESDFKAQYQKGVDQWWATLGHKKLMQELDMVRRLDALTKS